MGPTRHVRPTFFPACRRCKEASEAFLTANSMLAVTDPDVKVLQLTAVCGQIHKVGDEHPGTAIMQIQALKAVGEAGVTEAVPLQQGNTEVVVFCAGAIRG